MTPSRLARSSASSRRPAPGRAACLLAAAALGNALIAACGSSGGAKGGASSAGTSSGSGATLIVGTTDKVTALDPAGEFDAGSGTITSEIYATLLDHPAGSNVLHPRWAKPLRLKSAVASGGSAP